MITWKGLLGTRNFDEEREKVFNNLRESGSKITNLNPGGVFRTLLELSSQGVAELHELLEKVAPQGFVQYAAGGWLDVQAQEIGLRRRQALKTRGRVLFTRASDRTTGALKIPKGTICRTQNGPDGEDFRFFVSEDGRIPDMEESAFVAVEAERAGSAYNLGPGYLNILVSHVDGVVKISNDGNWITSEGADMEDDETLRRRCVLRWHELSQGATKLAYLSWALSVEGVRSAEVLDQHPRGQGTVDVLIVGENGRPTDALIQKVDQVVQARRPLCADVRVRAPQIRPVAIHLKVVLHPLFGDLEQSKALAERSVNALFVQDGALPFIKPLAIGEDLPRARLIHTAMTLPHVVNIEALSPAEDVVVQASELLERGSVQISVVRAEAL